MTTHSDLDARSLALHRLAVQKVRDDPSLLSIVSKNLLHWQDTVCPGTQAYLEQWADALSSGEQTILELAVEESENANILRQCSPFAGVLDHSERFSFLKNWREGHDSL